MTNYYYTFFFFFLYKGPDILETKFTRFVIAYIFLLLLSGPDILFPCELYQLSSGFTYGNLPITGDGVFVRTSERDTF